MNPRWRPLRLFLLLLALFPAMAVTARAVAQGVVGFALWEWALLLLFPVLLWIFLRHFSRLGCAGACASPPVQTQNDDA